MDSIPVVCLTGQVPTHLIGNDAFQEADTTGITRSCTKHNYLVKTIEELPRIIHEAFYVARSGRPGPVVVDLPKDVMQGKGARYLAPGEVKHQSYRPRLKADKKTIEAAVEMIATAKRPLVYSGGGVINSGDRASALLTRFVRMLDIPCTSTLMGLGAFPASDPLSLGMLGMHGTYEANLAMYHCDVMIAVGARFDDRVTGRLDEFAPHSRKIHIDIDPSSINKNVVVDLPIVGDVGRVLDALVKTWKDGGHKVSPKALKAWRAQIDEWRARDCLRYAQSDQVIKPQYAIQRLYELTKDRDAYITTEVGQHQMWAAQFYKFEKPRHFMTSGGLGTMGYGFPSAAGVQVAHPDALVIDIAGEASFLMNIQELSTVAQYGLPVKVFIINNQWMGMVRQWQELLHGKRYSESYMASLPDFEKLAEAFGAVGLKATRPDELDDKIMQMIETPKAVVFDCQVEREENCFPMIPSGAAHYQMLLGPEDKVEKPISEQGMVLV
jgi:acetolactate synthase-1/2/3 large subunit